MSEQFRPVGEQPRFFSGNVRADSTDRLMIIDHPVPCRVQLVCPKCWYNCPWAEVSVEFYTTKKSQVSAERYQS